jgi:hypothetical protein
VSLRGSIYRGTARLMHRFDFHHTRRIGPLAPDGVIVHRCEWCGVSRTEVPLEVTMRRMREARPLSGKGGSGSAPPSAPVERDA